MGLFSSLFGRKETAIETYADFWAWFGVHSKEFYKIVQQHKDIENKFFNKLQPKLDQLNDGFNYLTGIDKDGDAELVLTPDGILTKIVFVEELVAAAPAIPNWKFTALKPAFANGEMGINMSGYNFSDKTLSFYAIDHEQYPDEVDIVLVHQDYKEADKDVIFNGALIFLDNYIGELNTVTAIDEVRMVGPQEAAQPLIPISKLQDYLVWREKEFVEKYSGIRHDTEQDEYAALEATLENDRPLIAILNTTLLEWDGKASHPWMLVVTIKYRSADRSGLPGSDTMEKLNVLEDELGAALQDADGYLHVGRQTANYTREIYYACNDFRKPSKVLHELVKQYAGRLDISYEVFKDKYWQSLERFRSR